MVDTRFGPLEVAPAQCWRCSEPIAGFEGLSAFALLHVREQGPFLWLQSLELPDLAFLIVDAACFGLRYVTPADAESMPASAPAHVLVILPRNVGDALRVHRLAPMMFDPQAGTFRQVVFEPEQVQGDGAWVGPPQQVAQSAWLARIVELATTPLPAAAASGAVGAAQHAR